MKKAKQRKSNCLYGILLAAVVCVASGCAGKSTDETATGESSIETESQIQTENSTGTDDNTKTESNTEAESGTAAEDKTQADNSTELESYAETPSEAFDFVLAGIKADTPQYHSVMEGCEKVDYGYYDVNQDGTDELIISSVRGITIFMYLDGRAKKIHYSPYSALLENGMVWYYRPGAAPLHDSYQVYALEGEEYQRICGFDRYDANMDGKYDENDLYLYDDKNHTYTEEDKMSKEQWDELTQPYFNYKKAVLHDTGTIQKGL